MSWFKVDDGFYDHPKVVGLDVAAVGLWILAGTYCAKHLTDGVITARQIRIVGGTVRQAEKLVEAGLWSVCRDVADASPSARRYAFNDWREFQPSRDEVTTRRREDAERKRDARAKKRSMQEQRQNVQPDVQQASVRRVQGASGRESALPGPARPDPTRIKEVGQLSHDPARATSQPLGRCAAHAGDPNPPACGHCAQARRDHESWQAEQKRARVEAEREERATQADVERAAIDACHMCDDRGYLNRRVCNHDPAEEERNQRGAAMVRAVLSEKGIA